MAGTYSELQLGRIQETIAGLERRITDRFPNSGLRRVCVELGSVAQDCHTVLERLRRPFWSLRLASGLGIAATLAATFGIALLSRHVPFHVSNISDWLQGTEALLNDIIIVAIAVLFFVSLGTRAKRRGALRSLHRLRSVVHIVDMHQLTKDPEPLLSPTMDTESSPVRAFTRFELARYLDYSSEMLSLTSKLAALHVQYMNDPVVLNAVNDIETLAASLSNKIWQKIMILDTAVPQADASRTPVGRLPGSAGSD